MRHSQRTHKHTRKHWTIINNNNTNNMLCVCACVVYIVFNHAAAVACRRFCGRICVGRTAANWARTRQQMRLIRAHKRTHSQPAYRSDSDRMLGTLRLHVQHRALRWSFVCSFTDRWTTRIRFRSGTGTGTGGDTTITRQTPVRPIAGTDRVQRTHHNGAAVFVFGMDVHA